MTFWDWFQFHRHFGFGPIASLLRARYVRSRVKNGHWEFDPPLNLSPRWYETTLWELLVLLIFLLEWLLP